MARIFSYSLVAVTFVPLALCVMFTYRLPMAEKVLHFFITLGGAHVALTLYLTSDSDIRQRLVDRPLIGIVVPLLIIATAIFAIMVLPVAVAIGVSVAYLFYQAFHYGRQNIGVYVMTSLASGQGPMLPQERLAINLATACGMLVNLSVFMPNLILGSVMTMETSWLKPYVTTLYYAGSVLYAGTIAFTALVVARNFSRYRPAPALMLAASVMFFLPSYLTSDFLFGFLSYATAHGLQYVTILGFHSLAGDKTRTGLIRRYRAVGIFIGGALIGFFFYAGSGLPGAVAATSNITEMVLNYAIANETQARFVIAFLIACGAAHFWFDQNIWRFREPERRQWLFERFPFLRRPEKPLPAPTVTGLSAPAE